MKEKEVVKKRNKELEEEVEELREIGESERESKSISKKVEE
ncbi:hypothetical protein [Enterococcus faecalis]